MGWSDMRVRQTQRIVRATRVRPRVDRRRVTASGVWPRQCATVVMGLTGVMVVVAGGCAAEVDVGSLDVVGNPAVVDVDTDAAAGVEGETGPAASTSGGTEAASSGPTPTPGGDTTATPGQDPDGPTATPGSDAESSPGPATATTSPAPTPTAAPTPSPTPAPTSTPVPTLPPTPTPTPVPVEFVIAPDAALLGVEVGTEAADAMASLEAVIGPPDFDSGWYVGCPLDGDALDERLVQWGDLNVYFDRSDGDAVMRAWGYDLRIVDGGFPELDVIELPGGARMGDPVEDVAAAAGLEVRYDPVFDINRVGAAGYELLADAGPGAPVWGAFVPFIPICE